MDIKNLILDSDTYIRRFIQLHGRLPKWVPSGNWYYSGMQMKRMWMSCPHNANLTFKKEIAEKQKEADDAKKNSIAITRDLVFPQS